MSEEQETMLSFPTKLRAIIKAIQIGFRLKEGPMVDQQHFTRLKET